MSETLEIWAVTDGRAGNVTQALGLAEAIARARPAQIVEKTVTLRSWAAALPPILSWRLTGLAGWPFFGIADGTLLPPWPDLVIGAGRRVGPVVAALRRHHRISAIQLLDPQIPSAAFDVVVAPDHDELRGENVLTSVGALNRLTPTAVEDSARTWRGVFDVLPRPRVAVLIGGPSGSSRFGDTDAQNITQALSALSETHALMITPSRRTPAALVEVLCHLGSNTWTWDGHGANPYPGLLGHADAILVTEDSVNMASEASTTGLPVHVFPVTRPAAKITRFHRSLAERGVSRRFEGRIEAWAYTPLAEADRIAGELIARGII